MGTEGMDVQKPNPSEHDCEWCGQTARHAVPGRSPGTFILACDAHVDLARRSNETKSRN